MMFEDPRLEKLARFLGHGNLDARLWFIGMEEGAHEGRMSLARNIEIRVASFQPTMGLQQAQRLLEWPIEDRDRWTHVWHWMAKLSNALINGSEDWSDRSEVRRYVLNQLGTPSGNTFLAELLPLPSVSASVWPEFYRAWYADRSTYEREMMAHRITLLRAELQRRRPKFVIAYGTRHADSYRNLLGLEREVKLPGTRGQYLTGSLPWGGIGVITPFFGQGWMSTKDAELLITFLRRVS